MINYITSLLHNKKQALTEQEGQRQSQIGQKGCPGFRPDVGKTIPDSGSNSPVPRIEVAGNSFGQITETMSKAVVSGTKQMSNGKWLAITMVEPKMTASSKKVAFPKIGSPQTPLLEDESLFEIELSPVTFDKRRLRLVKEDHTEKLDLPPAKKGLRPKWPSPTPSEFEDESLFEIELSPIRFDNKPLRLVKEDHTEEPDLPPVKKGLREKLPPPAPSALEDELLFEIELSPIKYNNKRFSMVKQDHSKELDLPPARNRLQATRSPPTLSAFGEESVFEIELSPIRLDKKRLRMLTEEHIEELHVPSAKKDIVHAEFNVDNLIQHLLRFRDMSSWDGLSEYEVTECIRLVKEALQLQSMLLEVEAPLKICGDIHGQYSDLLNLFDNAGYPPKSRFLFLGDYVDRGLHSVEVICLLFAFKIKYPYDFFILRGNHEEKETNKTYGFQDECKTRYNIGIYKKFNDVFNWLPIAAIVEDEIFCAHGGISKEINHYPGDWSQIQAIKRPAKLRDSDLMIDILWSDPKDDITGYVPSPRGISYTFGDDVVEKFCDDKGIRLICRAHQLVKRGFQFKANGRILTIFSAPRYCNRYSNHGAYLIIDENLKCHVQVYD